MTVVEFLEVEVDASSSTFLLLCAVLGFIVGLVAGAVL